MFCLNIGLAYFSAGGGASILGSAYPGCGVVNNTFTCDQNLTANSSVALPYDPSLLNYSSEHKDLNATYVDVQGIVVGVTAIVQIIAKSIYLPWLFTSAPFYMPSDLAWYLSAGIWFVYIVGIAQLISGRGLKYYK